MPDVPWIVDVVDAAEPELLVLQFGAHGPFAPADLDVLLGAVTDVPNVIIVNAHADRSWVDVNNALIAERDQPGDNVIVFDWDILADQCSGECFAADGIHLSPVGAEYVAERLGDITGFCHRHR